ncbi:alpha/beta hydrolase [Halomonas vilamensis]|uniref:Alpha/beta hydrolase n=1 Tax=Vreelandella vilamensis TaxID=531309 RepID=A0ABU1H0V4_9GAMM|nr:alpha/beta hydrolase [Halomonas vilamensis]MDR5897941.1 alpha/beta hydrolase [Halomonas vilamensis]
MDAITIVPVGSLDIAVRVWHPNAPRTVIAWHGLARHGGDFEQLARQLGPKWRVLAPDIPGRGLSSWSFYPAQEYLYAHYMKVALAVLDHFQLDSVPWVGTSMGGLLGMLLAADSEAAPRLQSLVLNDVGPELDPQALTQMATYFGIFKRFSTFHELKDALKANYQGFGIQHESEWDAMAVSSARRLPDGAWSFHYDPRIAAQFIHDTPRDMWADWVQIRCPMMLIRGEHSPLLRPESMEKMRQTQPEMKILEAPGCGHAPMLNVESQVTPLRHFLERHSAGHTPSATPSLWQRWIERVKRRI